MCATFRRRRTWPFPGVSCTPSSSRALSPSRAMRLKASCSSKARETTHRKWSRSRQRPRSVDSRSGVPTSKCPARSLSRAESKRGVRCPAWPLLVRTAPSEGHTCTTARLGEMASAHTRNKEVAQEIFSKVVEVLGDVVKDDARGRHRDVQASKEYDKKIVLRQTRTCIFVRMPDEERLAVRLVAAGYGVEMADNVTQEMGTRSSLLRLQCHMVGEAENPLQRRLVPESGSHRGPKKCRDRLLSAQERTCVRASICDGEQKDGERGVLARLFARCCHVLSATASGQGRSCGAAWHG